MPPMREAAMTALRLFVVKDETWWALSDGPTATQVVPTIRPYRRRSWTKEALAAALAYIKAHPLLGGYIVSGSNTSDVLRQMHRRLPRGTWR